MNQYTPYSAEDQRCPPVVPLMREDVRQSFPDYSEDYMTVSLDHGKLYDAMSKGQYELAHKLARGIEAAAGRLAEAARVRFIHAGGERP